MSSSRAAMRLDFANAVDNVLKAYERRDLSNMDFLTELTETDPAIWNPRTKEDDLRSVWHFTDRFIDAAWHGSPDVDGVSVADAEQILLQVVEVLRSGQQITDPRLLRYSASR